MKYTRRAFTIVELLVVLVIISLLVTAATTSYVRAQRTSRDSLRKAQVNTIANAVETYYAANKKFPGRQNTTTDPVPNGVGAYNNTYQNCQTIDLNNAYVYFYYPLMSTGGVGVNQAACNDASRPLLTNNGQTLYDPTQFTPYPTWIPGLANFLNPFPMEKRFQDSTGGQTGTYLELMKATDDCTTNCTRTFVYRKLAGGYAVYTRLENSSGDSDTLTIGTPIGDNPLLPGQGTANDFNVPASSSIYMVRK